MKRILIILATLIVIIGIAAGIYWFYFAPGSAHLTVGDGNAFSDTSAGTASSTIASPANQIAGSAGTLVAPGLVEITKGPVANGFIAMDSESSTNTASTSSSITSSPTDINVRYIDRESGNVYEYGALTRTLTRISNKTLPGIQQASWTGDGSLAFVQFLASADNTESLDTYALPDDGNGGYFLQQDLDEALVTSSSTLFTLAAGTDTSIGTIANIDGSNAETLFSSPLTGLVVYGAGKTYIATTKAASELNGYAFMISNTGSLIPIIGPLKGLTVLLSPSGNQLLYSYTDGSNFHMSVLNLSTGTVTVLPLATIAEKCVWTDDSSALYCGIPTNLDGGEPDDWYQGAVSFSDRIWRIDLSTRLATLVLDPTQTAKTTIDAVGLTIDPNSQVLTFMNKIDGSLWAYTL